METRTLKHTDLTVSRACFGTMTFGSQVDEATAARMIDLCIDRGVNFFDTANVYNKGFSETIVGKALKGRRNKIILASKVRGKMGDAADESGLSKRAMLRAIDESLQRLQTDYLDLYYLHQPDYAVPIEDTLEAMEQLNTIPIPYLDPADVSKTVLHLASDDAAYISGSAVMVRRSGVAILTPPLYRGRRGRRRSVAPHGLR